jgi:hypothetical protein
MCEVFDFDALIERYMAESLPVLRQPIMRNEDQL